MVGLDLVDVARIERLLARRPAFARRYFSEREQDDCAVRKRPARRYAACLAAKEAFLKALGEGVLGPIPLSEVELCHHGSAPALRLGAKAARALAAVGRERALITLADGEDRVMAMVVLA